MPRGDDAAWPLTRTGGEEAPSPFTHKSDAINYVIVSCVYTRVNIKEESNAEHLLVYVLSSQERPGMHIINKTEVR